MITPKRLPLQAKATKNIVFGLALAAGSGAAGRMPRDLQAPPAVPAPSLARPAVAAVTMTPADRIDLRAQRAGGETETGRLLRGELPAANQPQPAIDDGTGHLAPFMLRGLSPDHTAIQVNGHRRHSSALVNVNNSVGRGAMTGGLDALPLAAVAGIDVVRGGGDPRMAAGAMAGGVNLRLHEELGRTAIFHFGRTAGGDGETLEAAVRSGAVLGRNGVVHVTAVWRERGATDRAEADTRQWYFGRGAGGVATPISGAVLSGTGAPPAGVTFDPREATAARGAQQFGDATLERRAVVANARLPLARDVELYGFGDFSVTKGESALFFRRPGDARVVRALWPDGFMPLLLSRIADWSAGAGWRGRGADGARWDLSATAGANTIAFDVRDTNNASLGAASPREMYAGKLGYAEATVKLEAGRPLGLGLAQPAEATIGVDLRREHYRIRAGAADSWRDGGAVVADGPDAGRTAPQGAQGFPGFRPEDGIDATRGVAAAYAGLTQHVNARLLLALAGRYARTEQAGETLGGSVSARVELGAGLAARGSVARTYRQPHLGQQWYSATATNFIGGQPFDNRTFPVAHPVARALGAAALKPEKGDLAGAGLTWNPVPAFGVEADVFRVDLDDQVVLSSNFLGSAVATFLESRGVSGATGGRFFTNDAATRTDGLEAALRWTWAWAPDGRLTFRGGYHRHKTRLTRAGRTPAGLATLGVTTPLIDSTEEIRLTRGQPRDGARLGVDLEKGRWSAAVRFSRYGEMEAVALTNVTAAQIAALSPGHTVRTVSRVLEQEAGGSAGGPLIGAATTVTDLVQVFSAQWVTDLDLRYRLTDAVRWSVGVANLFDVYPDRAVASRVAGGSAFGGSDNAGTTPYSAMTPFGFNGAFFYTNVEVKF